VRISNFKPLSSAADDAIYDLNGRDLCGDRVQLELAKRDPSRGGGALLAICINHPVDRWDDRGRGRSPPRGGGGYGGRALRFSPPHQTRHRLLIENLTSRYSWQVGDRRPDQSNNQAVSSPESLVS